MTSLVAIAMEMTVAVTSAVVVGTTVAIGMRRWWWLNLGDVGDSGSLSTYEGEEEKCRDHFYNSLVIIIFVKG